MAWAVVQTKGFSGESLGAITSVAFDNPATVGNILAVSVTIGGSGNTIGSITDNGSGTANTWTWIDKGEAVDDQYYGLAWTVNERTSLTTITVNMNASNPFPGIIAREYSGNSASPADGSNSSTGAYSSGTNVIASGTVVPTVAGDLILGGAFADSAPNVTAGTGFGNLANNLGGDGGPYLFMEDRTESGTAASGALFSSTTAGNQSSVVFALKGSGGAGPSNIYMWNFS